MIPGPTPLPDAVREALSRPAIGHRSAEFKKVLERLYPRLRWIFQTKEDVLLYTASGTGAMEAAVMNTLNPGDPVLVLVCGVFSERWAEIAESLELAVTRLTVPPGQHHTPEQLEVTLSKMGKGYYKAVFLTHSETSTGVLNPVQELVPVIRQHGALVIVDVVTSLGATPVPFDDWGLDIAVSGSQKGFMTPPGLSFLALSQRAWEAHRQCQRPGYYFNFGRYKKAQDGDTTPYTPATPLIQALDVALDLMEQESLPSIHARHRQLQAMTRAGVQALGLSLFVVDEQYASPAVTSVMPPEGIAVDKIRAGLREQFGIVVADGQKELKGKIFRIGHLGYIAPRDVLMTLAALEQVLLQLGYPLTPGAAVAAAEEVSLAQKRKVTHA